MSDMRTFLSVCNNIRICSWDSSVSIVTGYGVDGRVVGVEARLGQEFSHLHIIQTGSVTHRVSYPMGTGGSFSGG
jgi:hypothetical protein